MRHRPKSVAAAVAAGLVLAAGCGSTEPDHRAQTLLTQAAAASSEIAAVEGTVSFQLRWLHSPELDPQMRAFAVDADGDLSTRDVPASPAAGDGRPWVLEERSVAGDGYLRLPVPGPSVGLSPGPVWQHVALPDTVSSFDLEDMTSSALVDSVCVLAPHAFPPRGCHPLAAVSSLAAAGSGAAITATPTSTDPATEITFTVPLRRLATPEELAAMRAELGTAALATAGNVGLDMTIRIDAQSRIVGARFDVRQLQVDIMRAASMPHNQPAGGGGLDTELAFVGVELTFAGFGDGVADVVAPSPQRVFASYTDVVRQLRIHDRAAEGL